MDNKSSLTIIVASHNQKELLKRCINSIISQRLTFNYEIILSDDSSTDGSWELTQELAKKYPQIKPVQCNTKEFPCFSTSQHSGWNRQCAYKEATGDYIAFIDADDYYKKDTQVLQQLWELLESHSECAAAMANNWSIEDGAPDDTMVYQDRKFTFSTGQILSAHDYMDRGVFRSVTAFMFRRLEKEDLPISALKGFYIDTVIAAYYLQFGDIVCLEDSESGYVYVQYHKSASHVNEYTAPDWAMWGSRCIYIPSLMPYWRDTYLHSRAYRGSMLSVVKKLRRAKKMNMDVVRMFEDFHIWIYDVCAKEKRTMKDRFRFFILEWIIRIPQYIPIKTEKWYELIWLLMCKE